MQELHMFIDGRWGGSASSKKQKRSIVDPATGVVIAEAEEAEQQDVEAAVNAAYSAFQPGSLWRNLSASERAELLNRTADLIEERADELARLETLNTGKLYRETRYDDICAAAQEFRCCANLAGECRGNTADSGDGLLSMTVREPLGVCAIIVPWNYPLGTAAGGIAPALAAGNTVVVKPSSLTPLSAVALFQIFEEAGFPRGSVNLLLGSGKKAGKLLAESQKVSKIVFTGGTQTGRELIRNSASSVKKLALELGGKSAFIVFDDADIEAAVDNAMFASFLSQGQLCVAGSRLLVQEGIYDQVTKRLKERVGKIRIGMPMDEDAEFGPLISQQHMQSVLHYIRLGQEEGAKLLVGGKRLEEGLFADGYFIEPTVFCDCSQSMRIVQEEIFGPVLTVQKFSDEESAIELANDVQYGLAGAVFTKDLERAVRVCRNVNTGIMWVNTYLEDSGVLASSPHKQSGIGLAGGIEGIKEFTVLKQINVRAVQEKVNWFQ